MYLKLWYSFNLGPIHNLVFSTELDFSRGSEQFNFILTVSLFFTACTFMSWSDTTSCISHGANNRDQIHVTHNNTEWTMRVQYICIPLKQPWTLFVSLVTTFGL